MPTNLLNNPSFETTTTPWEPRSNCTLSRTQISDAFDGAYAGRMTAVASGDMDIQNDSDRPAVTAGTLFVWSARVRPVGTTSRQASVFVEWIGTPGAVGGSFVTCPAGQWTTVSVSSTAPAGTTAIRPVLRMSSVAAGEQWLVDGLAVYTGTSNPAWTSANATPVASLTGPSTATVGQTLTFTGSGTDSDGTIASYSFTLPTRPADSAATLTGTGTTRTLTADKAGTYTVSLQVVDNAGTSSQPVTASTAVTAAATGTEGPYRLRWNGSTWVRRKRYRRIDGVWEWAGGTVSPGDGLTGLDNQMVTRGGGYVTGLSVQGSRTYARTDVGGVYRYDSGTDFWTQLLTATGVQSPTGSDYKVEALAAAPSNPDIVYAAVGSGASDGKVLRSADAGATWTRSTTTLDVRGNAEYRYGTRRLAVHPTTPGTVLFGTRAAGLQRSTDSGATFTAVSGLAAQVGTYGGVSLGVTCVAYDPTDATRYYAAAAGVGLYLWNGSAWSQIHAFAGGWCTDLVVTSTGTVWATFRPESGTGEVIRYTKAGTKTVMTGSPATANRRWTSVAVDPTNEARVVLADTFVNNDGARFLRTTNGTAAGQPTWADMGVTINAGAKGTTWVASQTGADTGQVRFTADGTALWFAAGFGMYRCTDLADSNATLTFTSDGIEELVANRALKPAGKPWVTVTWDKGVWQHPDPANRNPAAGMAAKLPHVDQFGSAWDLAQSPTDSDFLVAILDDHQDLSGNNLARRQSAYSTDGGSTWTRFGSLVANTHPADLKFGNVAVSAGNNDNIVWAPGNFPTNRLYYSTDRGASWSISTVPGAGAGDVGAEYYLHRKTLLAHPSTAGTFLALANRTNDPVLLRSTDSGAAWSEVTLSGIRTGQWGDFRFNSKFLHAGGYLFALPGVTDAHDKPFWRSTLASPGAFTQMDTMLDAHDFGVGAPLSGQTNPTLYGYGKVGGVYGFYRSSDLGATWTLIATRLRGLYDSVSCIAGDPEVPGRFVVGYDGNGFVISQLP